MTGRVIVVGSLNVDTILGVTDHPRPGETVHALSAQTLPGGKGGNQAVAAAAAGSPTIMIGAVGADGARYLRHLRAAGVDVHGIRVLDDALTGAASVVVDARGENSIIVSEGANAAVVAAQLDAVNLRADDVVSLQFELPPEIVSEVASRAAAAGATVLINPSPWRSDATDVLAHADIVIVNELEAEQLGGMVATERLCVTAGGDGARWSEIAAQAPKIVPVDTTGAGDCFAGTLAAHLAQGATRERALDAAVRAASDACLRHGAQQWRSV